MLQPNESLSIMLSDWLKVSSPVLKNAKKFPPIELPDGREVQIKLDDGYFRVNDFYKKGLKGGPPTRNDFWFRLSGKNLYYSINQEDINVLGSIAIKSVKDAVPTKAYANDPLCFNIVDEDQNKWKLCAKDFSTKADWVCRIKKTFRNCSSKL